MLDLRIMQRPSQGLSDVYLLLPFCLAPACRHLAAETALRSALEALAELACLLCLVAPPWQPFWAGPALQHQVPDLRSLCT